MKTKEDYINYANRTFKGKALELVLNNIELFSVESEQLGDTYNQPELGLGGVYFSLKNIHSPIGKMKMIYDILAEVRR